MFKISARIKTHSHSDKKTKNIAYFKPIGTKLGMGRFFDVLIRNFKTRVLENRKTVISENSIFRTKKSKDSSPLGPGSLQNVCASEAQAASIYPGAARLKSAHRWYLHTDYQRIESQSDIKENNHYEKRVFSSSPSNQH